MGVVGQQPRVLYGPGTPEMIWEHCTQLQGLRASSLPTPPSGRVVVIAPHPDDEILGAGGTLARLSAAGADVVLVAVTDGEKSHPDRESDLRRVRRIESLTAAVQLEIAPAVTWRLEHPDGAVDEDLLAGQLADRIEIGDMLLAPWQYDGHPDHDRVGRAALEAARWQGATVFAYLVWAWHWARPSDIPWAAATKVALGAATTARKRQAVRCFESQITGPDPILPSHVLARLTRSFEVLLSP